MPCVTSQRADFQNLGAHTLSEKAGQAKEVKGGFLSVVWSSLTGLRRIVWEKRV